MKRTTAFFAMLLAVPSLSFAQQIDIEHESPACLRSGENPYMTAKVHSSGTPRMYFRRQGTADWCSVDGVRVNVDTRFVLPEFENDFQLEYYIATIDDGRITGRSASLYRTRTSSRCDGSVARHSALILPICSEGGAGDIGTALGAGYMLQEQEETELSPSEPPNQLTAARRPQ